MEFTLKEWNAIYYAAENELVRTIEELVKNPSNLKARERKLALENLLKKLDDDTI